MARKRPLSNDKGKGSKAKRAKTEHGPIEENKRLQEENKRLRREKALLEKKHKTEIELLEIELERKGGAAESKESSTIVERRTHKFEWLKPKKPLNFFIPDDLINHITRFLSDDDLFKFRVVNLLFYQAYYGQETKRIVDEPDSPWEITRQFDAHRALRLATMGRKFPKVEFILTPIDLFPRWQDIQTLSPRNFPALRSIYIAQVRKKVSLRNFPHHPLLEAFYCPYYSSADARFINEEKYPALRMIDLQAVQCEATLPAHSKVEEICFIACGSVRWNQITRKNFPSLTIVKKYRRNPIPSGVRKRFKKENIDIEENNLVDA